jgi:hypothetical protein
VQVLAPTRELAKQVAVEFEVMAPSLGHLCIYGGAMYGPQESALRRGLDVVVSADDIVLPFCCLPLRASVCTCVTPALYFSAGRWVPRGECSTTWSGALCGSSMYPE